MNAVAVRLLSKPEAAAYLGVSYKYFRLALEERFTVVNLAPPHQRAVFRIDIEELDAYVAQLRADEKAKVA